MPKKFGSSFLVKNAIIAAVYVALTASLAPISFGPVQFRLSEVLVLLAFLNWRTIPGLTLGVLIANIYSPFGIFDMAFGTLHTFLGVTLVALTPILLKRTKLPNVVVAFIASLWPTLLMFIIAFAIRLAVTAGMTADMPQEAQTFYDQAFLMLTLLLMLSQFLTVTVVGLPLFKIITRNKAFVEEVRKI